MNGLNNMVTDYKTNYITFIVICCLCFVVYLENVYTVDVRLRDMVSVTGPGVGRVPVNQVTSFMVRSENSTTLPVSVNITGRYNSCKMA